MDIFPRKEGKINFLKEVKRILKPGKYFFFTAHNLWGINQYLPGNILRVIEIFFSKIFYFNLFEREYGEKYDNKPVAESPYIDIKSKRTWDTIIRESGFQVALFNSKCGIRDKREFSLLRDYFGDGSNYLFFVLKK